MTPSRVVSASFTDFNALLVASESLQGAGQKAFSVYSPVGLEAYEARFPRPVSPMRLYALAAGLAGCLLGFWMAVGSAYLYDLYVGGKPSASWVAYCIVGFELTILTSALVTTGVVLAYSRLFPRALPRHYTPQFSVDEFGVAVPCDEAEAASVVELLKAAGAREVHED